MQWWRDHWLWFFSVRILMQLLILYASYGWWGSTVWLSLGLNDCTSWLGSLFLWLHGQWWTSNWEGWWAGFIWPWESRTFLQLKLLIWWVTITQLILWTAWFYLMVQVSHMILWRAWFYLMLQVSHLNRKISLLKFVAPTMFVKFILRTICQIKYAIWVLNWAPIMFSLFSFLFSTLIVENMNIKGILCVNKIDRKSVV